MKPAPFEYHDPRSIEEAVGLLGSLPNARALAGGQSLMPMMNFRVVSPDHVIDLNKVAALSGIEVRGRRVRIGATTRQRELEFSAELAHLCPLLREALKNVGHRQTRNRGTIGGSLAHADPSAELPTVCSVLSAQVDVRGPVGAREIRFSDFGSGFMATALESDELLCAVEFDCWAPGHGYSFQEYARRRGDFAIVGAAALIERHDGIVSKASLSICGVAEMPIRLASVEKALIGMRPDNDDIEDLAEGAGDLPALSDHHASADYRQHLVRVLTARALRQALDRAEGA